MKLERRKKKRQTLKLVERNEAYAMFPNEKKKLQGQKKKKQNEKKKSKANENKQSAKNLQDTTIPVQVNGQTEHNKMDVDKDGDIEMKHEANQDHITYPSARLAFTEQQRHLLAQAILNAKTAEEADRLEKILESGQIPSEGLEEFLKQTAP
ncbi:hypothetical protein RFI_31947 [Reticulomyxa filosa]|uniref:Uncharacterized protein n=1 Tax=Reticulomyxa filosa TaxID=46433 RepID=X6LU65_RETFI|nr:hypothetical protein RFI_31947 [Reticulomyxa filosa]|eukprot:ETO05448.1 hypothetical protein RFI_31947 [Reticulomyxa filosa]